MRFHKGLVLLAALSLLLFAVPSEAACPLADPNQCIYVDDGTCGVCEDGVTSCRDDADCGLCIGVCTIGSTPCQGDADCAAGTCQGSCSDGSGSCIGDAACVGSTCTGGAIGSGTIADPFCRIQDAYDAAPGGVTTPPVLLVMPGTYDECVIAERPEDKPVRLVADAYLEQQDNTMTTIDGSGICTALPTVILGGTDASLEGFTITGSTNGGVFAQGSVSITSNLITGNTAAQGAGIYLYTGACYYGGSVTASITNNEITNNTSQAEPQGQGGQGTGDGGGVYVFAGEPPFSGCSATTEVTIDSNVVTDNVISNSNLDMSGDPLFAQGGGIFAATAMEPGGVATVRITQNQISGNGAEACVDPIAPGCSRFAVGGGVFATTYYGFGDELIQIDDNTVGPGNTAHFGGGVAAEIIDGQSAAFSHTIDVTKNDVSNNQAFENGGGIQLFMQVEDLVTGNGVTINAVQNQVDGNIAGRDGGGLDVVLLSARTVEAGDPLSPGVLNPADSVTMHIEGNTITNNESDLGGGGAILFPTADTDPETPCGVNQLPTTARIDFVNNLVAGNNAKNVLDGGFIEVGGGVLAFVETIGDQARATVAIDGSTIAGNSIGSGNAGGLEILPLTFDDCQGVNNGVIDISTAASIVSDNDGYGVGGSGPFEGTLLAPVTNSFVSGNAVGNFDPVLFAGTPFSSSTQSAQLNATTHTPAACSPVFNLFNCAGTTTTCMTDNECAGVCVIDVGFHSNPDVNGDSSVEGLDLSGLAVAFGSTDLPDPRFDAASDLDSNGIIDGDDLTYMASQFGQVCTP